MFFVSLENSDADVDGGDDVSNERRCDDTRQFSTGMRLPNSNKCRRCRRRCRRRCPRCRRCRRRCCCRRRCSCCCSDRDSVDPNDLPKNLWHIFFALKSSSRKKNFYCLVFPRPRFFPKLWRPLKKPKNFRPNRKKFVSVSGSIFLLEAIVGIRRFTLADDGVDVDVDVSPPSQSLEELPLGPGGASTVDLRSCDYSCGQQLH